ncbi:hypothetical protein [Acinetobacter terrestris]|uniref:Uncharacterized protein n=1 Tax=Acinetobacter terrestris TaxID=2529843 RepID=A0AAW6UR25_9GAMM|nr:hypothetical protein [Acinetobacter terrestris]MDK1683768.1 hypothetical protein [Acinetobacter terrestris]TCB46885.1 hypothetical protein E0H83_05905 [Acinetobacter terrestris]TCB55935.1 hypothetical protein E0H84_05535 [Acinetobacter terrestris]
MKRLLILSIIFAVLVLGYWVYQDAEMKKKREVNQLIHENSQSLNIIEPSPHNFIYKQVDEVVEVRSSVYLIAKSSEL